MDKQIDNYISKNNINHSTSGGNGDYLRDNQLSNNQLDGNPLVVANWKMNGSKAKIHEDLQYYLQNDPQNNSTNSKNVIFALPYLYLSLIQQNIALADAQYKIASQDISQFDGYGAYTGEISGAMLPEFGVTHTIIGHSERRGICGDTDKIITHKLQNAIRHKLTPIYCIGESLALRQSGEYSEFLLKQLDLYLKVLLDNPTMAETAQIPMTSKVQPSKIQPSEVQQWQPKIIIAYEPIWSIGTGIIPEMEQIEEIMDLISNFILVEYKNKNHVENIKISTLYGGSVTSKNIGNILQVQNVGGVLVGGASLNVAEFTQICSIANSV